MDYMSESLKDIFRANLKQVRSLSGVSQASLAEAIGKSADSVSSWERGKREIQIDDIGRGLP